MWIMLAVCHSVRASGPSTERESCRSKPLNAELKPDNPALPGERNFCLHVKRVTFYIVKQSAMVIFRVAYWRVLIKLTKL